MRGSCFAEDMVVRPPSAFGDFIRRRKPEILAAWKSLSREDARVGRLADRQLLDHVPFLLDRIAELSDASAAATDASGAAAAMVMPHAEPLEHARQRVVEGFDLAEVVDEYARLRECILELWEGSAEPSAGTLASTRPLHRALDHAVSESVNHYVTLRNRTLKALDALSAAAFESTSLDAFLERLLRVFLDTMPSVQTCAILLVEGDCLRLRASVGLEAGLSLAGFT